MPKVDTQPVLAFEHAMTAVTAALARAREIGAKMNCAVVDVGGNLLAFGREPGAFLASIDIAIDKAWSAAGFRMPTTKLWDIIEGDPAVREGILRRPRVTAFGGGLPILVDGALAGGIGVSGGSVEEDVACAQAGLDALAAAL